MKNIWDVIYIVLCLVNYERAIEFKSFENLCHIAYEIGIYTRVRGAYGCIKLSTAAVVVPLSGNKVQTPAWFVFLPACVQSVMTVLCCLAACAVVLCPSDSARIISTTILKVIALVRWFSSSRLLSQHFPGARALSAPIVLMASIQRNYMAPRWWATRVLQAILCRRLVFVLWFICAALIWWLLVHLSSANTLCPYDARSNAHRAIYYLR